MDERKSEQDLIRIEKLKDLRSRGFSFPNDFMVNATCIEIRNSAAENTESTNLTVSDAHNVKGDFNTAGRILAMRLMGKAAFLHIQDRSGLLQVYVRKDELGDEKFEEFKQFDLGDIVGVSGFSFRTKTGEPSLHARKISLLVKCLHPLPEKWHGLTDVEVRYRQRYLDLIVNPGVRDVFRARSRILGGIRNFLNSRDFIEVETPIMTSVASGAAARPFTTHHNTLNLDLHLRIALELPLKRLVVGGFERVYEIGRNFRNEGISTHHNPEFTMLEFYQAYATYNDLMDLTEELVVSLCDQIAGKRTIAFGEHEVNYERPWKRLTMVDALYEIAGVPRNIDLLSVEGVQAAARYLGQEGIAQISEYGIALYELFDEVVESKIVNPTFITRFPIEVSPLSRKSADDARFVDRFELFVAGMELANAFSELNDAEDQLERFKKQQEAKLKGDSEAMELDEDFVRALEYGMPPTAGEGIGIDRLVMLLTGQESIRDVILFPQMRPQAHVAGNSCACNREQDGSNE